jgi:hypothetical protein
LFHSSNLSNDLLEIENAFLNVLTSKNINSRIDEINIVKKKRIRKSSENCEHDLNKRKNDENFRILHNNDDRLQYESVRIRNKDDIVV